MALNRPDYAGVEDVRHGMIRQLIQRQCRFRIPSDIQDTHARLLHPLNVYLSTFLMFLACQARGAKSFVLFLKNEFQSDNVRTVFKLSLSAFENLCDATSLILNQMAILLETRDMTKLGVNHFLLSDCEIATIISIPARSKKVN